MQGRPAQTSELTVMRPSALMELLYDDREWLMSPVDTHHPAAQRDLANEFIARVEANSSTAAADYGTLSSRASGKRRVGQPVRDRPAGPGSRPDSHYLLMPVDFEAREYVTSP